MPTVFITGASGNIGSACVRSFLGAGYTVLGQVVSDKSKAKLVETGVSEVVQCTVKDVDKIVDFAKKADVVVHTAADYGDMAGTDRALSCALIENLSGKKFIYTSGVWVYGDRGNDVTLTEEVPIPIEQSFPFKSNHRCVLEGELVQLGAKTGAHVVIVRPSHVVSKSTGIPALILALSDDKAIRYPGPGTNMCSLVHQEDMGAAYLAAAAKGLSGSIYNIAAVVAPLKDFAAGAKTILGDLPLESLPIEEAHAKINIMAYAMALAQNMSSQKAVHELGWAPKHTTIAGLWA